MKIEELKEKVENGTLEKRFLILQYSDSNFIAKQYVKVVANSRSVNLTYVDSLDEIKLAKSGFYTPNDLFILNVETFDVQDIDVNNFDDTVVICNKVSKDCLDLYKDYIVVIPKVVDWQIIDFISNQAPGLTQKALQWLCYITNNDIVRIQSEIDKIKIFPKSEQQKIFESVYREGGFNDLNQYTVFNFTNAIQHKDVNTIKNMLIHKDSIDLEPAGILSILIKNFKSVIDIQSNAKATADSLKMSPKQFYAIKKYNCGIYSQSELVRVYNMLTNIDYKLKSGNLEYDRIIDYITINCL